MAGFLNYGAGAYTGLEDIMDRDYKRQIEERLLAAQQEVARHNQAAEGLQSRTLDQNGQLRQDSLDSLKEQREANILNQKRDDIRARVAMGAPGDKVSAQEYGEDTGIGMVPAGRFKQTSTYQGMSGDDASTPDTENEFEFLGMPVKPGAAATQHLQDKEYTINGKVRVVQFDPATGKHYLGGKEIDDQGNVLGPKPPAPDRVLVQTDQGLIPRPTAASAAGKGSPMQPPLTSSTRTMMEGAKMLQPHIDDLKDQASSLDQAGMFGPVMSRIRHLSEKAGTLDELNDLIAADPELSKDRRIGRFSTSLGLLATGAGRVHGGARGGGSPQMLLHFKQLLNDSSSLEMFLGRLDAVDDYMGGYATGPSGAGGAGGGSVPSVGGTFQGGKVLKVTPIP